MEILKSNLVDDDEVVEIEYCWKILFVVDSPTGHNGYELHAKMVRES